MFGGPGKSRERMESDVRKEITKGVALAKKHIGFLALVFAGTCNYEWLPLYSAEADEEAKMTGNPGGMLKVSLPTAKAAAMKDFKENMQRIMRTRYPPSYWWDTAAATTRELTLAIQGFHDASTSKIASFNIAKFLATAAARVVERFAVYMAREGFLAKQLLPLLSSLDKLDFPDPSSGKAKARLKRQQTRKACLLPLALHLDSRAEMFYFQRLEHRIIARVRKSMGLRRAQAALDDLVAIMAPGKSGALVDVQMHHAAKLDAARKPLALMLQHALDGAYAKGSNAYLSASGKLAEDAASVIEASALPLEPIKSLEEMVEEQAQRIDI
jgi:hypothetical protein